LLDKQSFGIFATIGGLKKDFPNVLINKVFHADNKNVLLKDGGVYRRKMRLPNLLDGASAKTQTPDTYPIIHYHRFVKRATGVEYILAFTKAHIYYWNPSTKAFDLKFTCSADCENWETVNYNDKVIATNDIDPVLVWDTTGYFVPLQNTVAKDITGATQANPCVITIVGHGYSTGNRVWITSVGGMTEINNLHFVITVINADTFSLDGINSTTYNAYTSGGKCTRWDGIEYETGIYLTKAKYITTFENYLILGYTYENDKYYPQRIRWCDIGDETNWITGYSGSAEVGKSDFLSGFGKYQGFLIVFKKKSYFRMWAVPTNLIFNMTQLSYKIGCKASHSIVNDDKGRLYWFASDKTFKEISAGTISGKIQTDIVDKIYDTSFDLIKGTFIGKTGEVWWTIPYENALNNKVIAFREGVWNVVDMAVSAFGDYREP